MASLSVAPRLPLQTAAGVELRAPSLYAQNQFEAMMKELARANEKHHHGAFAIAEDSYENYLRLVLSLKERYDQPTRKYPVETFFIYFQEQLIGEVRYRQKLAPEMEDLGGHITIYIRPSMRLKGLGTDTLRKALVKVAERQRLITVLLVCLSDNLGAMKIMKACGGISIPDVDTPMGLFKRFRFFLPKL